MKMTKGEEGKGKQSPEKFTWLKKKLQNILKI